MHISDYAPAMLIAFLSTYAFTLSTDFVRALLEFFFNRVNKWDRPVEVLPPSEVAFVVPCHNSEDVIEATIKTLPPGYKAFCVENASTDNTAAKIREIMSYNPNVQLVTSPLKGKIRAVLYGVKAAKDAGCTHFVLLDDDIEWPNHESVQVHSRMTPITALPVIPTQPVNWIHGAQVVEYQMMVIGKRAQSFLGNVIMASGAAGVYRIDTFFEAMKEHDGEHIGDDLQCSYIHHRHNMKIDLYSKAVVRTHPPQSFMDWWKQRARRWEVSPLHNLVLTFKIIFGRGQGWWIRVIAAYRLLVSINDVARCISFPMVIATNPAIVGGVWAITYVSLVMKIETYQRYYGNYMVKWDRIMWTTALTYPFYGALCWVSRIWATPKGLAQLWRYHVMGAKKTSLLRSLVESLLVSGSKTV